MAALTKDKKDAIMWDAATSHIRAWGRYDNLIKSGYATFSPEVREAWRELMASRIHLKRVTKRYGYK